MLPRRLQSTVCPGQCPAWWRTQLRPAPSIRDPSTATPPNPLQRATDCGRNRRLRVCRSSQDQPLPPTAYRRRTIAVAPRYAHSFVRAPVPDDARWVLSPTNGHAYLAQFRPGQYCPPQSVHARSEEHTSELQSRLHLVCRLLLEKKK